MRAHSRTQNFSIWQSVTLPWLNRFRSAGLLLLRRRKRAAASATILRFDVRARSIETPIRQLSGGNQQKVILGRWLSQPLRVLLLDEPTHGVDVGAKEEIYRIIRDVADRGVAVLVVSSELQELERLATRVVLLREGRVIGELSGPDVEKGRMLSALYGDALTIGADS